MRLWIKLWLYRLTRTCVRCGTTLEPPTSTYDVYRHLSWGTRWQLPTCRECMKRDVLGMGSRKLSELMGWRR